MHRVLAIPELLDTIFRMMDNRCNLNNALVSRAWSEIALDTLWRQVDDLHRLFNLLAPLRKASSGKYVCIYRHQSVQVSLTALLGIFSPSGIQRLEGISAIFQARPRTYLRRKWIGPCPKPHSLR